MTKLVGFEPSIKLELQFTGLDLLYLYVAAKSHYDGHCRSMVDKAGDGKFNGKLTLAMWNLGQPGTVNFYSRRDEFQGTDEQYLYENREETANIVLTWREVDTLAKIAEMFDLIGRSPKATIIDGVTFDMDAAARVYMGLRGALNAASIQQEVLNEQEALRREEFAVADCLPKTLGSNAN